MMSMFTNFFLTLSRLFAGTANLAEGFETVTEVATIKAKGYKADEVHILATKAVARTNKLNQSSDEVQKQTVEFTG
jgi:hypothetical protein